MNDTRKFWQDLKSGRFVSMVKESAKGQRLSNSQEVYNILKPMLAEDDDVEKVYIIFLDAQNKILAIEKMFSGSITAASIYPREVVKRLIKVRASAFLIVHNHPSGDTKPSDEDKSITIKVGIAAASIDVTLHDHIIIGDGYHSMADTGWLKKVSSTFSDLFKSKKCRSIDVVMTKKQQEIRKEISIMNETEAIKQIHALLDGKQWYTHTIERIAEIVVSAGRVIREPLICKLCGFTIDMPELAHRHGDGWIGEDCCWEVRLKTTK